MASRYDTSLIHRPHTVRVDGATGSRLSVSKNTRFLLWQRGLPRDCWQGWLMRETAIRPGRCRALLSAQLSDEDVTDNERRELESALELPHDANLLHTVDFVAQRCDVLRENL